MSETRNYKMQDEDFLNETVVLLEKVTDVLKETLKTKETFSSICRKHGLNWQMVRTVAMAKSLHQINGDYSYNLPIIETLNVDGYEKIYHQLFDVNKGMPLSFDLPPDYKETVDYVLDEFLNERNAEIQRMRVGITTGIEMSLEDIKKKVGLSRERIRQILAINKKILKQPKCVNILLKGKTLYLEEEKIRQENYKKRMEDRKKELKKHLEDYALSLENDELKNNEISIDELNLSSRAYNSLRRCGINTVEKLAKLSDEDLINIQGLGEKTVAEIKTKLANFLAAI